MTWIHRIIIPAAATELQITNYTCHNSPGPTEKIQTWIYNNAENRISNPPILLRPTANSLYKAGPKPRSSPSNNLQSIRGDETVNVNKPSPVSPQLTARSGQRAQLVQCTHCIPTHVNLHSDFGHPCNGTRFTWSLYDFILRAKEISRAFVYVDCLVCANGLPTDCSE
jgi:hypothetical protein